MKSISFILFTFLLFVAPILGKIQNVYLYVRSQNQTVNGNGLYSVKERPGINYFFLGPPNRAQKLFMTIRTIIFINKLIHKQDIILVFKEISYNCPKVTLKELS